MRFLIAFLLLVSSASAQSTQVLETMRAYSVRVGADGLTDEGEVCWDLGSGVMVDAEGGPLVVSCYHVLGHVAPNGKTWYVMGDENKYTTVIATDSVMDLAVLDARAEIKGGAQIAKFMPNQVYYMAGFKNDNAYHVHTLRHIGYRDVLGGKSQWQWPLCTGQACQGDSGGGVFDASGHVVGVVWGAPPRQSLITAGEPFRRVIAKAVLARSLQK